MYVLDDSCGTQKILFFLLARTKFSELLGLIAMPEYKLFIVLSDELGSCQ